VKVPTRGSSMLVLARHSRCAPVAAASFHSFHDGKFRSPSSSIPGPSEPSRRRARTCSESCPNAASRTAWVPTSIRVINRTFGNAPPPLRLRDWMNAARLVSLSGTSSMLASQDTSRRPNRNAPGVAVVARPPRTRANSAANGARPTRRRACVSPDVDGSSPAPPPLCTNSRHTPR
jgi:hypothetical protein